MWGDSVGNIFISENTYSRIRKISIGTNIISVIVGTGISSSATDEWPATSSAVNEPTGLMATRGNGMLYFCDLDNNKIRYLDSVGLVHAFAGTDTGMQLYYVEFHIVIRLLQVVSAVTHSKQQQHN